MTINEEPKKPEGCEQFVGKICKMQVRGDSRPISGKVISVSTPFLTLEHKDGHKTLIRVSEISVISLAVSKVGI